MKLIKCKDAWVKAEDVVGAKWEVRGNDNPLEILFIYLRDNTVIGVDGPRSILIQFVKQWEATLEAQ